MGGISADPVETGLVASLARPGGNITGMSMMTAQLGGKRLELIKATVPGISRVAVFWNPPNPAYGPALRELEAAAPTLGLKLQRLEVRVPGDLEGAFEAATRQRAGALIAPSDPLVSNRPRMVADLALKYRLPAIMDFKEYVEAGGLLSLQHRGAGKLMLCALEAQAARWGLKGVFLMSSVTDKRFYERNGYVQSGEPKSVYGIRGVSPMAKTIERLPDQHPPYVIP